MASSRDASKPYTSSHPGRNTIHPHGLLRSEPNIAIRPTTCLFAITSYSARFAVGCSSRSSLKLFRRSQVQGVGTTDTVTLISDAPAILTTVPETGTVKSSCPWKSAFAVYEKDGPWISTLPYCGGAISFTSFMFVDPSFKPRVGLPGQQRPSERFGRLQGGWPTSPLHPCTARPEKKPRHQRGSRGSADHREAWRRARQPGRRAPIPRPENLGDTSRVPWRKLAKCQKPRRGRRRGLGWQYRGDRCQTRDGTAGIGGMCCPPSRTI